MDDSEKTNITGKIMALQHIAAMAYARAAPAGEDIDARLKATREALIGMVTSETTRVAAEAGHAPASQRLIEAYDETLSDTFSMISRLYRDLHDQDEPGSA